jgi:hypothetical protein
MIAISQIPVLLIPTGQTPLYLLRSAKPLKVRLPRGVLGFVTTISISAPLPVISPILNLLLLQLLPDRSLLRLKKH